MANNRRRLRRLRVAITTLTALATVLVLASAWLLYTPGGPLVRQASSATRIGGPFRLITHRGSTLSDRNLASRPFAVFFGFTHCSEVCPTTLWEMSEALRQLGPDADRLRVLFISVDPARDTPELLASYLQSFDPRIIGLTGTEEEIASVAEAYRAYWKKVPKQDGDYTMNHTASVYLMDARGRFFSTIAYGEPSSVRMDKLRKLLDEATT